MCEGPINISPVPNPIEKMWAWRRLWESHPKQHWEVDRVWNLLFCSMFFHSWCSFKKRDKSESISWLFTRRALGLWSESISLLIKKRVMGVNSSLRSLQKSKKSASLFKKSKEWYTLLCQKTRDSHKKLMSKFLTLEVEDRYHSN